MKTSAWTWQSFSWCIPRKRISRHQRQSPNTSIDMFYHHQCRGQRSVRRKCTIKWTLLVKITAISTRNLNKFLHACLRLVFICIAFFIFIAFLLNYFLHSIFKGPHWKAFVVLMASSLKIYYIFIIIITNHALIDYLEQWSRVTTL